MIGIGISDLYFLVPANLFLLIVFYKSKFPRYIFLFLLVALSYSYIDMADYEGYLQMYEAPQGNSTGEYFLNQTDIGFRFFVYIGNYLNLKFDVFKSIVYFIFGIFLIRGLIKINDKSTNLVLSLYMFYPLILDLVQFRHFMAMSSFIYGFSFFLKSFKQNNVRVKDYFYFVPCVLFHNSFLYLVVLVFISNYLIKYIFTYNFLIKNFILLIGSYFFISSLLILLNLSSLTYFTTKTSTNTIFFYLLVYGLFYLLLMLIINRIKFKDESYKLYKFIIIFTTLLISTTFPMLFYNVEFFRYFRVELLILLSIMFSITLTNNYINRLYTFFIFALYISLAIIIFSTYYIENLILPLLLLDVKY